jgi:hypothetical protein
MQSESSQCFEYKKFCNLRGRTPSSGPMPPAAGTGRTLPAQGQLQGAAAQKLAATGCASMGGRGDTTRGSQVVA